MSALRLLKDMYTERIGHHFFKITSTNIYTTTACWAYPSRVAQAEVSCYTVDQLVYFMSALRLLKDMYIYIYGKNWSSLQVRIYIPRLHVGPIYPGLHKQKLVATQSPYSYLGVHSTGAKQLGNIKYYIVRIVYTHTLKCNYLCTALYYRHSNSVVNVVCLSST